MLGISHQGVVVTTIVTNMINKHYDCLTDEENEMLQYILDNLYEE